MVVQSRVLNGIARSDKASHGIGISAILPLRLPYLALLHRQESVYSAISVRQIRGKFELYGFSLTIGLYGVVASLAITYIMHTIIVKYQYSELVAAYADRPYRHIQR